MSNLGTYQMMTTLTKKLGGPFQFAAGIAVGGYAVLRIGEAGIKKGVKILGNRSEKKCKRESRNCNCVYSLKKIKVQ